MRIGGANHVCGGRLLDQLDVRVAWQRADVLCAEIGDKAILEARTDILPIHVTDDVDAALASQVGADDLGRSAAGGAEDGCQQEWNGG